VVDNPSALYGYDLSDGPQVSHGVHDWHALSTLLDPTPYMNTATFKRTDTIIKSEIAQINNNVAANPIENGLIKDRLIMNTPADDNPNTTKQNYVDYLDRRIFEFNVLYEMGKYLNIKYQYGSLNLAPALFSVAASECPTNGVYWAGIIHGGGNTMTRGHDVICSNGGIAGDHAFAGESLSYRVATFLDLSSVVFALSDYQGTAQTQTYYTITAPQFNGNMAAASGDAMKLRLLDQSMSVDFTDILNKSHQSIYTAQGVATTNSIKIAKDDAVLLKVNANAGGSGSAVNTVSVLIFDNADVLIRYIPLGNANGMQEYTFDTAGLGLEQGKTYSLKVVNERYTGTDPGPTMSSALSDVRKITIVEPHQISYTKTPQSGASRPDYEYAKNVNAGAVVGKVTLNPIGIAPITYTLEGNGDSSYENFEIDGLSNGTSSATTLNIKIKNNAPDLLDGSLKAGDYKFCITSVDANGYPDQQIANKTKVCTTLTVNKTALSVSFNDPNQTKKSITEAQNSWSETASATPNTGTKVTYTKVGGDISLINIDPDSGAITFSGTANSYGKITIQAIADDDPSTGNDNYETSSPATKE
ncbi:MAG: hypothetical protein HFE67_09225, partial [Erysipelotrichaceae bacterium]|nr:hypothetical protein [Erysipelotrichaceae bacterium]